MKQRIPVIIFAAVLIVLFAIGIPTSYGLTRIGLIFLDLIAFAGLIGLIKAGRAADSAKLVGADLYDDPQKREEHQKNGTCEFSLLYSNGDRRKVTVRKESEEYWYYCNLSKKDTKR